MSPEYPRDPSQRPSADQTAGDYEPSPEARVERGEAYHDVEESPYGSQTPAEDSPQPNQPLSPSFWGLAALLAVAVVIWVAVSSREDQPEPLNTQPQTEELILQLQLDPDGGEQTAPPLTLQLSCDSSDTTSQCLIARQLPPEAFSVQAASPDQACTEIYGGPDTLQITGEREGQPFALTRTRENGCEIDAFDLWVPLLEQSFPSYQPGESLRLAP